MINILEPRLCGLYDEFEEKVKNRFILKGICKGKSGTRCAGIPALCKDQDRKKAWLERR